MSARNAALTTTVAELEAKLVSVNDRLASVSAVEEALSAAGCDLKSFSIEGKEEALRTTMKRLGQGSAMTQAGSLLEDPSVETGVEAIFERLSTSGGISASVLKDLVDNHGLSSIVGHLIDLGVSPPRDFRPRRFRRLVGS